MSRWEIKVNLWREMSPFSSGERLKTSFPLNNVCDKTRISCCETYRMCAKRIKIEM